MSHAFISLLTDESYFAGIHVMLKSLRNHNRTIPVHIMVTNRVSQSTVIRLQGMCDSVIFVEEIPSPYTRSDGCWARSEFTKLHLWNLIQFEKIVYLDADVLVISGLEELFALPTTFAAAPDIFPPDKFNAGVMMLVPSEAVFHSMIEQLGVLPTHDLGDTGFLNSFYPDWYRGPPESRLSFGYNAQRTLFWHTQKQPGYWQSIQPLKVIHYSSSPKPWETDKKSMGELEWLWWRTSMLS